jgi:hypothetical protein
MEDATAGENYSPPSQISLAKVPVASYTLEKTDTSTLFDTTLLEIIDQERLTKYQDLPDLMRHDKKLLLLIVSQKIEYDQQQIHSLEADNKHLRSLLLTNARHAPGFSINNENTQKQVTVSVTTEDEKRLQDIIDKLLAVNEDVLSADVKDGKWYAVLYLNQAQTEAKKGEHADSHTFRQALKDAAPFLLTLGQIAKAMLEIHLLYSTFGLGNLLRQRPDY